MPADAARICNIYNQGIEERIATFETRLRSPEEIEIWLATGCPIAVAELEGAIGAFAGSSGYRPRDCYAGIREFSIYTARECRGRGLAAAALGALLPLVKADGAWKLVSRIFPENAASRKVCANHGFREVGTYKRHAMLDGAWRDVVIVEKLL